MGTWLSAAEVDELTALKRWGAQRAALIRMGIRFITNRVGRPLVARSEVELAPRPKKRDKSQEPHW